MNSKRKVCYVTGTRADFGLMRSTLELISQSEVLDLHIVATGMHLSERYGNTVDEIYIDGKGPSVRVPVDMGESTGAIMANNLADVIKGCVKAFLEIKPDMVLVLGDRGEMLGAALAAIHMNIPIAHIHGGERSGTVDEPVRHAISKLANFHFVSNFESRERLIRMGELPQRIFVTGAPGLDGIESLAVMDREQICSHFDFDTLQPIALMLYHPVLSEADEAGYQARCLLEACVGLGLQVVALMPNSDAGSDSVRSILQKYADVSNVRIRTHLTRPVFVSLMAACDVMLGNSSSGIIEAASFGTPVVNIGSRQNLRTRNVNTIDCEASPEAIVFALTKVLKEGRYPSSNIYGNGGAGKRISELLSTLNVDKNAINKVNSY